MTRYITAQYGKGHIRCNRVAPGLILTPAAKNNMPQAVLDIFGKFNALPYHGERMISVIPYYSLHLTSPNSLLARRSKWIFYDYVTKAKSN